MERDAAALPRRPPTWWLQAGTPNREFPDDISFSAEDCAVNGDGIERRRFGRREVFKPAHVLLADETILKCVVVNISEGGALIDPIKSTDFPDSFELVIPGDDTIAPCRVAHRTAGKIGVEFVSLPRRASRVLSDPKREARLALLREKLNGQ